VACLLQDSVLIVRDVCVCEPTEKGSEDIHLLDDGKALISSVRITVLLHLRKQSIEMLLEGHEMS